MKTLKLLDGVPVENRRGLVITADQGIKSPPCLYSTLKDAPAPSYIPALYRQWQIRWQNAAGHGRTFCRTRKGALQEARRNPGATVERFTVEA